ncbi:MAG: hypothetical protein ACO1O3_20500 [Sphingobium sp.]
MSFSTLEWTVIRLAAAPREARSARASGFRWIARHIAPLSRAPSPLADPRLEALRVLAAALHRRRAATDEDMVRFLAAGWSEGDAARVVRAVDQVSARER